MPTDVDVASVAAVIGKPARAAVLLALADGRPLSASALAAEASVAPSTLSGHLSRLLESGLVVVEAKGRHRYVRLSGPEVADALESLCRLARPREARSFREAERGAALRRARSCYDHIAGRLGVAICDAFERQGHVRVGDGEAESGLVLTDGGLALLDGLGVTFSPRTRRPLVRPCLDWSERRPHLGGLLGAALLDLAERRAWVVRGDTRVLLVTQRGREEIASLFAADLASL